MVPDRPGGQDIPHVPPFGVSELGDGGEGELRPRRGPVIGAQRDEGSCAAFALAAATEIQLRRAGRGGGDAFTASVRMLDRMARRHDEWIDDAADGTSLRAALKGFYQNGVCSTKLAGYTPGDPDFRMTRAMALDARRIILTRYLRVPDDIAAMQAAIRDTGAVLVAARIHHGWQDLNREGRIPFDAGRAAAQKPDAHAFAATGYLDEGFIVQNSWGPDWGGWDNRPGHAVWSYEDWARNVLDAWVIRPAPCTPRAFGVTAAREGGALPEARRSFLNGHVAHSEDDGLVRDGMLGLGRRSATGTAILGGPSHRWSGA